MVRTSSALAAFAAALLIAVLPTDATADSQPEKTVRMQFERRHVPASEAPPNNNIVRRQTAKTVNAQVSNEYLLYLINVTVGTPPQPISLQIDTGSSDIWFASASSRVCQAASYYCEGVSYDLAASSTGNTLDYPTFRIQYVDGTQVSGQYIADTIQIGGATVRQQTMASATTLDRTLGILGIGFQAGESSNTGRNGFIYPNLVNSLKDQGLINTLSYSLWLDDLQGSTGSILFGGVDSSKYTGHLTVVPIQRDAYSDEYTSFTVPWTGLTVSGSGNNVNLSPSAAQPAILDSGTTLLYLPDDIVNSIYNGVGVATDPNYGNVIPCRVRNDELNFTFEFGGSNGARIVVPLREFIVPLLTRDGRPRYFQGTNDEVCLFGIEAAGNDPILFGDTFLRSAYTVYDLENREIGLAQLNPNASPTDGNVDAFVSGGGIPDATTTATEVSVSQTFTGRPVISVSTAGGDGEVGGGATSRSATYRFVTATGSATGAASSGTENSNNGGGNGNMAGGRPEVDSRLWAVLSVTIGAFAFGAMLI